MPRYRFFDYTVQADCPLPGLPAAADGEPDWRLVRADDDPRPSGAQHLHTWPDADGGAILSATGAGAIHCLDFPGLAVFRIDAGGRRIDAWPRFGCAASTLNHLLLDQVLPRAVAHTGRVVLHAAAVQASAGSSRAGPAIALAAPAGGGKSTLAAAFRRAGHTLLTDDCLLLERRGGMLCCLPAYPSLRLWPDSLAAIYGQRSPEADAAQPMAHYAGKLQLHAGGAARAQDAASWSELGALLLLDAPDAAAAAQPPAIRPARGAAVLAALVAGSFALDVSGAAAVRRKFESVGALAGQVRAFRLSYRHDFGCLPQIVEIVTEFLQRSGGHGGPVS